MAINTIPFSFPMIPHVHCAFQTTNTGSREDCEAAAYGAISLDFDLPIASIVRNRRALIDTLGLSAFAECKQVHGATMLFDPEPSVLDAAPVREADGMGTQKSGLGLLVKSADCQPILCAHLSGKYIAALHVGWKGNRIAFPHSGLLAFCHHYAIPPQEVCVVRGPSLSPAMAEFIHFDEEWGAAFRDWYNPTTQTMDLWSLTRFQLEQAGIPSQQIYSLDLCTASIEQSFFSYRRSRESGRQASVIWRK